MQAKMKLRIDTSLATERTTRIPRSPASRPQNTNSSRCNTLLGPLHPFLAASQPCVEPDGEVIGIGDLQENRLLA
jgi:hypothetical protein